MPSFKAKHQKLAGDEEDNETVPMSVAKAEELVMPSDPALAHGSSCRARARAYCKMFMGALALFSAGVLFGAVHFCDCKNGLCKDEKATTPVTTPQSPSSPLPPSPKLPETSSPSLYTPPSHLVAPSPAPILSPTTKSVDMNTSVAAMGRGRFSVGPYTAEYFDMEDLVFTETVPYPRLEYNSGDEFHKISPFRLRAAWTTTLEVSDEQAAIQVVLKTRQKDTAEFYLDGIAQDLDQPLNVGRGQHNLEIRYSCAEPPVSFAAAVREPDYSLEDASAMIENLLLPETVIVHADPYKGGDRLFILEGKLSQSALLVLTSYKASSWTIENPYGVKIVGVAFGSYVYDQNLFALVHSDGDSAKVPIFSIRGMWGGDCCFGREPDLVVAPSPDSRNDYFRAEIADVGTDDIVVGPFQADYFFNHTVVFTESVDKPSTNGAPFRRFLDSDGPMQVYWTGSITVKGRYTQFIDFEFSSYASLLVDGERWDKEIALVQKLTPGKHDIEVNFTKPSLGFTGGIFNSVFTKRRWYTTKEIGTELAPMVGPKTLVAYVDVSFSRDEHNNFDVYFVGGRRTTEVLLVLRSMHSVNWVVHKPSKAKLVGVVYGSQKSATTIRLQKDTRTYAVYQLAGGSGVVKDIAGRGADVEVQESAASNATINLSL